MSAQHPLYATRRWAVALAKAVGSENDPRTIRLWAQLVGVSTSQLGNWCRAARVGSRQSLEFARLLRAIRLTSGHSDDLLEVLDITEPRTLQRLLARSGAGSGDAIVSLTVSGFLARQTLIQREAALSVLLGLLRDGGLEVDSDV